MGRRDENEWHVGANDGWYGGHRDHSKNPCTCAFCNGFAYHVWVPDKVVHYLPPSLKKGSEIPDGYGIYRIPGSSSHYYLKAGCQGNWRPGDPGYTPTWPHLEAKKAGVICTGCKLPNEYAVANQPDGTYKCYNCR